MNIDQEIQDLLYRNNCVIVPNFGAFICSNVGSQLLENQNFIPPKKNIIFNKNIVNNDGLLANYVAQYKSISFEDSQKLIQDVVTNWNDKLNLINKFYIKNVGSFVKNENNVLIFNIDDASNFLTSSFGLSTFVSPIIEKNKIINEVYSTENEVDKISIPVNKPILKPNYRYWKIAAIFLLFLTISTSISIVYYNNKIVLQTQLTEKKVNKKIEKKISEATFVLSILPYKNFSIIPSSEVNFHVIAGSFSNPINAEKLHNQLQNSGYKATILSRENKMFSVSYISFTNEIEAENFKTNIQKTSNPDAWVLQIPK